MPSSNIEKIEVIANPGARYDASGGAVINIVLKRNANMGLNGNVSLTGSTGIYNKEKEGLAKNVYRISPAFSLNYRKDKWNIYGGYSVLNRTYFENGNFDRNIESNKFVQINRETGEILSQNFRLGADYYLNKSNTFGVLLRGFHRTGDEVVHNITNQTKISSGQLLSSFNTINAESFKRTNLAANLNWKHSFDTAGKEMNIDLDYSRFKLDNKGHISIQHPNKPESINDQTVDNPVQLGVLKLDYTHPINNVYKIDAGVKSTLAKIDNSVLFLRSGVKDARYSSEFVYIENVNAAYINAQQKGEKWELIAGIRMEQTIATGDSVGKKVLDRSYIQAFPSAFLTYKVTDDFASILQYSKRVNRPSFQQQNPFIDLIDSITYTRGNPLLKPEITHGFKFSLTYRNQPFLGVSYNKTNDVIFDNAPRQEGNITYTTAENLAQADNITVELNFPIKLGKKIEGFGSNQLVRNHYKAEYLGGIFDRARWNYMFYSQVSYKPTPTLSVEVTGFYMTRFLNEFLTLAPFGNMNIGIQKTFWEKKGRISLNFNDIFYSNRTNGSLEYQDINVGLQQKADTRSVRLTFSYSFGNQKLKAARNRATGADAETNRVNTN
jgi:outer membrane receptor protein involved in Fe transport